ncbi:uncharacterized protein [Nicotiana tomentosiformis]|uniref:uncharacterized protein n=1 Tax=Nicotiana tomentosiformis TaxID=4098 RepID=UPI00388C640C
MRFVKKGKLSLRYVGPYKIIQRIGQVAYKLELPPKMSLVYPVFHVSMLKKVVGDPSVMVPVETIEVNEELTYEEILVAILDSAGINVDPKKIKAVQRWPRPSTAIEIWSFLALAGYNRCFVEGFSSIVDPLTRLTQKGAPFWWFDECEESFQKLKTALTTTPVLVLPSALGSYTTYCDASQIGIRSVLMSLQHLFKQKDLNLRQQRRLEILKDNNITILYHHGKANVVADALLRKAESMGSLDFILVGERSLDLDVQALDNMFVRLDILEYSRIAAYVISRSFLFECIKVHQYDDPHFLVLKDTVQHDDAKEATIGDNGVLSLHGRICIPNMDGLRELIIEDAHSLRLLGTDLVRDSLEKVKNIQERLRTSQSRQKSYAYRKALDVAYMVGEKVLLSVLPMKGVMRFEKKGKLSLRHIGSFEVLERVGEVAYKLALPPSLSRFHIVFHVSMLWKCYGDPSHVLDFSTMQLDGDLTYDVEPVAILGR